MTAVLLCEVDKSPPIGERESDKLLYLYSLSVSNLIFKASQHLNPKQCVFPLTSFAPFCLDFSLLLSD